MLGVLENGLFALAQVLRLPVMALLWLCVGAAVFMAGSTLLDFLMRRRDRQGFDIDRWLKEGSVLEPGDERHQTLPTPLRNLLGAVEAGRSAGELGSGGLEHLILEREERLRATLTGSRMLVKIGPSLGLIGTLIPMGTALAALASGNLETMAGQMVVAFTTTIIGIGCGTIAYVVMTIRQHWVNTTVREQRFLAEHILTELGLNEQE